MKRNVKIGIFCFISIFLNLGLSLLTYDVCHFPLFLDTVFTVAMVFYLGLIPGLIVGILYNFVDVLFNLLVRGINSPTNIFFSICGAAIVIVTWLFARKKEEFQISLPVTILYLLLISLISSFVTIFIGGTFDFIRFSFYDIRILTPRANLSMFHQGVMHESFVCLIRIILLLDEEDPFHRFPLLLLAATPK